MNGERKPIRWIGTTLRELRSFPGAVRRDIGHALFAAQEGRIDPAAKPLKGFGGASVLEIVASHHGNAWRAVYTVRFQDAGMSCTYFRSSPRKASLRRPGRLI
jgi:phage-related protein